MNRKLIIVASALLAVGGIACWRFTTPFQVIRQLDARYQQVQRGMSTNQVQALMSYPGRWSTNGVYRGWGDAPIANSNTPQIGTSVAYSIPTFFLSVTFEFTFDDSGKVVGKHRYD